MASTAPMCPAHERCSVTTPSASAPNTRRRRAGAWALLVATTTTVLPADVSGFTIAPQVRQVDPSLRSNGGAFSGLSLRHSGSRAVAAAGVGMTRSSCEGVSMSASTGTAKGGGGALLPRGEQEITDQSLNRAVSNAKRLAQGDLTNLELLRSPADIQRRRTVLNQAYQECERITGIFAKTFYLGTKFMSPVARKAIWAIYVWCRRTDDIVDGPRAMVRGKKSLQKDLEDWSSRLEDVWEGKPRDSLDLALVDVREVYPTLPIEPFKDMIDGMVMDVPGIGKNRYKTFEELELYCYRVAGTVGLMVLPVLGTAPGVSEEDAKFPALSLGIALQLTNILRDVGEDAVRGRIYLPLEDMEKFGVDPDNIMNGILDDNYKEFMRYQIARARFYYQQAARGIPMLAPQARLPVQASLDMYSKILEVIENNNYDNFRNRAYISKVEKLLTLPFSYLRSLNPGKIDLNIDESEFKLTRFDKIDMVRETFPKDLEEY
uniref:15-cis-phytoene synthase n=2 Tax=Sargassum TaxID=3015 RepID=A0A2D2AH07_9PHAE|nr:phytoene synthetase [Sargassum vachellianum]